jgi:D-xylose transport system substrate-binding protein
MVGCREPVAQVDKEAGQEEGDKPLQIGLSIDSFVIERWIRDRDVFVSTAKELGAEVNVQNANGDVNEQIEQIKYFIKKKMDVIVVVAGDSEALSDVMKKAKEAGIKTVSYDRLIKNAGADIYISFDNEEVGRLMAKSLNQKIPEGGKVFMIQGPQTDNNVRLIRNGFDLEINKNLEVVYENNCDGWIAENAYNYAKEALEEHPDVKGIMCGNDDLATQVFRALSEDRLAGKVYLVGQDGDLMACQRIMEGTQTMTAFKYVEEEARLGAEYAVKLGRGEPLEGVKKTIYDGTYEVPYLELSPVAVNKENMDSVIIKGGFHSKEDVYLNVKQQ